MNRTMKSLILAAGFAVTTLTLTVAPAHADGPGDITLGPIVDPELPVPPKPKPPVDDIDEITDAPNCTHGCGGEDAPQEEAAPTPAPEEDFPELDQGCFTGCDLPEEPAAEPTQAVDPVVEPAVAPVLLNPNKQAKAETLEFGDLDETVAADEDHVDLLWIFAGGAVLSGLLLAAAARRRRTEADQA